MAEKPKPPTYDELKAQLDQWKTAALGLERQVNALHRAIAARDLEIAGLKKRRQRALDPNAASPFDRPYDGR